MRGIQRGSVKEDKLAANDFLSIEGIIRQDVADHLLFQGKIVTQIYHVPTRANGSKRCERNGELHFTKHPGKKYYRLDEDFNACGDVTDYIDLYMNK